MNTRASQGKNERNSPTINTNINTLADNVLLDIFDFYRHSHGDSLWEWHLLVHVCQRWRQIIFESPCRLDLKIRCTTKTPVKKNLGIWPAFPIAIDFCFSYIDSIPGDAIAALEHTDRIGYLKLDITESQSEPLATMVLSKQFPMLIHLIILVEGVHALFLPDDFLGESSPRLQTIYLRNVTFPALKTLLLSASDLVELQLHRIPLAGYILSPVEMTMILAELPRLETLVLQFRFALFTSDSIHAPPVTRPVLRLLPALTTFDFMGTSQYLMDFMAHIDCPRLNGIAISFLSWIEDFHLVKLSEFLNRTIYPFRHAKVRVNTHSITFDLYRPTDRTGWDSHPATTVISCLQIDWHLFRVLSNFSAILSTVVDLKFVGMSLERDSIGDEHNLEWFHFLHQLPALQALYVSPLLSEQIGRALKSVKGEVVAEALPSLDLICLEDQASSIEEFAAVRQLSDCLLTVVSTEAEFDQRLSEK